MAGQLHMGINSAIRWTCGCCLRELRKPRDNRYSGFPDRIRSARKQPARTDNGDRRNNDFGDKSRVNEPLSIFTRPRDTLLCKRMKFYRRPRVCKSRRKIKFASRPLPVVRPFRTSESNPTARTFEFNMVRRCAYGGVVSRRDHKYNGDLVVGGERWINARHIRN